MRVTIERVPEGVRIVLLVEGQPPRQVYLEAWQVDALMSIVEAAKRADVFKIEWEG